MTEAALVPSRSELDIRALGKEDRDIVRGPGVIGVLGLHGHHARLVGSAPDDRGRVGPVQIGTGYPSPRKGRPRHCPWSRCNWRTGIARSPRQTGWIGPR